MANKGQKFKSYTTELKLQVVHEYEEKQTPPLELAYRYGVTSQESVIQWIKKYREQGEAAFVDGRGLATAETAKLKGRPRKYFSSKEEEEEYKQAVEARNKKRRAEKQRKNRAKSKRLPRL